MWVCVCVCVYVCVVVCTCCRHLSMCAIIHTLIPARKNGNREEIFRRNKNRRSKGGWCRPQ